MVKEAEKNPVTVVGKEICASHIVKVWDAISAYVVQQLCHGRGVRIPGKILHSVFNKEDNVSEL